MDVLTRNAFDIDGERHMDKHNGHNGGMHGHCIKHDMHNVRTPMFLPSLVLECLTSGCACRA
jgi:hypothetical protein